MVGAVMRSGKWRIKPSGQLPIFLRFMINSSFDKAISNKAGIKHNIANRVYLNHMMYWPASEYDAFEKEIVDHLKKQDGWLEKYCYRELKKSEHLYNLGLKLEKVDWAKKTNAEMEKILDNLLGLYRELACPWYAQYPIDIYYESVIEEKLLTLIRADHHDFRKFVLIFTDPKEMTDVAKERWELMKLAKKLKQNGEKLVNLSQIAEASIKKHLSMFAYINRGLATSKPYTRKDIISRIKEAWAAKEGLDELISYSSPKKIIEDYKWALNQVKPDGIFKKIIDQARLHSYTRNRRVEALFLADYGASFMYHEIAKRSKFNPNWIMEVSIPEMYEALHGQKLPNKVEMQRRLKNYAMIVRNANTRLITDPVEIKKMEKKYIVKNDQVNQIQGRVACLGGVIRGRAKICLDKSDIGKVKRGDVLVAQFTTPDFVPAMERAVAIVADQGGLSSHAAIVSRELGVPCVMATENGTRVIKDNDLIEVNARTGVIKIIKRAK
ncbi:MAG: PEP-utilizing enzyme [Patescibacteria group bacterium]|nr:PEP-utilizing enzyme [Patescibacteria group bacterium]